MDNLKTCYHCQHHETYACSGRVQCEHPKMANRIRGERTCGYDLPAHFPQSVRYGIPEWCPLDEEQKKQYKRKAASALSTDKEA
jgi:hypothetical protein